MAFNLALLSDDTPEELALSDDANDAVVAEIAEGPDADLAAMDDVAGDIGDATATIEEGDATADTMEAVAEQVDLANKDGGLSAPAAEALRLCIEHMSARVGIAAPRSLAAEGFASKSSRVRSGQLAAEGINDTAKQVWDWILKAYEKVKAWVLKWFNNFFDGATKVKNRAEKLKKAAEAKSGASVDTKDAKITAPAYAVHLTVEGKPASAEKIVAGVGTIANQMQGSSVDEVYTRVGDLISKVDDAAAFDPVLKKMIEGLSKMGGEGNLKGFKVPDDMTLRIIEDLPFGGKVVIGLVPKVPSDENIGKMKFMLKNDGSSNATLNMDMIAAQPADVAKIAAGVEVAAGKMIEEKKDLVKYEKAFKGVTDGVKRAQGNTKDEAKARVKKVAKVVKALLGLMTNGIVQVRQGNLQSLNAALNYGAASLNLAKA